MSDRPRHPGFSINLSCDVMLSISDLWPDGNAPQDPTVADVAELVRRDGGLRHIIRAWNLDAETEMTISGPGGVEVVLP